MNDSMKQSAHLLVIKENVTAWIPYVIKYGTVAKNNNAYTFAWGNAL